MKLGSSQSMGGSKRRVSSRGLGAVLKEQRAKLYIIRRCGLLVGERPVVSFCRRTSANKVGSDPSLMLYCGRIG
ncbi:hypothetical protein IGI04_021855 [Brassica rapa subsp. trilocularis]|uniref:Uncharacterized protein n=1 Tax=Brassica rapa subsp. trilocularis TaxID=1813537 RepID=A0ABQ7LZA0_BRACM|nr:hypothetical protein IGI04_021855 [Brassica rapa subsp. trilocularis]